jgi:hypothetical protein
MDNPTGGCDESINGMGFGDGIADNETFGMTNFAYYCNPGIAGCNGSTQGDPELAAHFYNYLSGSWKDGTRMGYGGNGHVGNCTSCESTNFMFPDVTDPCNWGTGGVQPGDTNPWTEQEAGNQPNDRRGIASAGPFTFESGDTIELEVAYTFGRDYVDSLNNPWSSVVVMQERIDSIRSYYSNDLGPCGNFSLGTERNTKSGTSMSVFPNPAQDMLYIKFSKQINNAEYAIYDLLGKTIVNGDVPVSGKMDISDMPKGIYILHVEDKKNTYHHKFIKM